MLYLDSQLWRGINRKVPRSPAQYQMLINTCSKEIRRIVLSGYYQYTIYMYFIIISILIKLLQVQHYRPKFQGTPEYDPSRSWLQCQRKLWTEEFKFESGEQLSLLLKLSTLFLLFNSVRFNFICDISPVCFYVIKYNPIVPNNSSGIQIISFRALISRTNSCEHFSKSFQTSYLYGRKYFIRKLPSSLTTTTL